MSVVVRNNVASYGQGRPTFLFAHGFGCDQNMWSRLAPSFGSTGRVVLFDHVGAGASDVLAYSSNKYRSLQGYADDVIEICETEGLKDVVFVGHSVSCTIGVLAAVARPDLFSSLVLICPSPSYINGDGYEGGFGEADIEELLDLMDKNHLDWSAVMAPVVIGEGHDPSLQTEWRDSVCRVDPVIVKEFARVTFKSDHRADFAKVSTPTLLVECNGDALAPPQVGDFVHDAIQGSHRVVLESSGHSPHMSSPDQVVAAIRNFMKIKERKAA
jgi:sigma-B regulation protein RsbQ